MKQYFYTTKEIIKNCSCKAWEVCDAKQTYTHYIGEVETVSSGFGSKDLYHRDQYILIGLAITLKKVHGLTKNAIKNRIGNYLLNKSRQKFA